MLVATTEQGIFISLGGKCYERKELIDLRQKEKFFCPVCYQEVILKLGSKQAWHFAHKRNSKCTDEMEGESEYHITGKKLLYDWLAKQKLDVQLEPYLKEVKQRPDLLVRTAEKTYVIEFQCAKLSPQLFLKRTQYYLKYNYFPLWILGANQLHKQFRNVFRLTSFHWLFSNNFHPNNSSPHILSFCANNQMFIFLKNITAISPNYSTATPLFFPLHALSLQQLYEPEKQFSHFPKLDTWLNTKKYWRIKTLYSNQSLSYLRKLYLKSGQSLALFPSEAGIPIPFGHFIETPTYIWQSWIVELFIKNKQKGETFHINLVKRAFETLVKKGVFHLRLLPLLMKGNHKLAIEEYLMFLCYLKILASKDGTYFKKINDVALERTVEKAIMMDRQTLLRFQEMRLNHI